LAFENTNEPGYVSEKVFDGLIAGVVPIYLGSTEDCKKLMPTTVSGKENPAVVYTSDFQNNPKLLADFLLPMMGNETLYNSYRSWRNGFDPSKGSDLLIKSWPCRICEWAVKKKMGEK
jgi:hypothetical protein